MSVTTGTAVEQGIAQKSGISLSKIGPLLAIVAPS